MKEPYLYLRVTGDTKWIGTRTKDVLGDLANINGSYAIFIHLQLSGTHLFRDVNYCRKWTR
jgi:hypothetical protein